MPLLWIYVAGVALSAIAISFVRLPDPDPIDYLVVLVWPFSALICIALIVERMKRS